MIFDALSPIKVLVKLLQTGVVAWDAWETAGVGEKEVTAVRLAIDAVNELRGNGRGASANMAAVHWGVITQCFGHALGRQWAFNKALAPRGLRLFMSKEQRERADEIELRVKLAVSSLPMLGASLAQPGDLPASVQEVKRSEMLEDPLATPYYRALWDAFSSPKLDEGDEARPPLLDLEKGRLEFERGFLLAYHQALASPGGEQLQQYVSDVTEGYRARTLRELLLRDMAGWGNRHIFGNLERHDRAEGDPIPFMPLEKMYVEPEARLVKQGQPDEHEPREPVRQLIQRWLRESKTGVVVVRADFGMGKSLTARSLAQQVARQFLDERTPSSGLQVPVFIQCAKDLTEEGFDLNAFARRAWMRQAADLELKLNLSDPALVPPGRTQPALFLLDGLDEVILGERRLESFFQRIKDAASEHHRFIIFSRPGALPAEQELEGIPVLEILPWNEQQISGWLEAWRGLNAGTAPALKELRERKLGELAKTPILLFMIAQTWKEQSREASASQAALYEEFFWRIARGKHEADRTRHKNIFDASSALHRQLVGKKLVAPEAEPSEAMLWLMGRVAWEATKLDQQQMIEPLRRAEVLTKHGITNLLVQELKLEGSASDTIEAIQVGLLLSLQAHLRSGAASQLLFGHKSFREFLVARYWADRLRMIARAPSTRVWESLEDPLLGARLLSREDRTFEFLMEMLDGEPHPQRPAAPFGLTEPERQSLLAWAQARFESEEPEVPASSSREDRGRQPSLRDDRRPWLREAALAIGSSLRGSSGMRLRDKLTIRSMLAWFWLMRIGPILVARKAHFEGAVLSELNLRGADFREADLRGAILTRSSFLRTQSGVQADFTKANLEGANLLGAVLEDVDFRQASLRGADLTVANLMGADLSGADLTGAVLEGTNLNDATYDKLTRWPEGFDPGAGALRWPT